MSCFVILITTIVDWEHVTLWIIEGIICLGSYLILAAKNIDKLVISTKNGCQAALPGAKEDQIIEQEARNIKF